MAKLLPAPRLHLALATCCIMAVTFSFVHQTVNAADLVKGRYLSASGTAVVLSLSIQNPSPANLIVEQYLTPGNNIVATSPPAKKVAGGNVKWLFRNTKSGSITLSIQLKKPLQGKASAMVRYRDPIGGSFTELRIVP